MTKYVIIALTAILLLLPIVFYYVKRRRLINKLKRVVSVYNNNYDVLTTYLDKDLSINQIFDEMFKNIDMSAYEFATFTLEFGTMDEFKITDTKDMRKAFMIVGNFILDYEEFIKYKFGFEYSQTDEYKKFRENLLSIRIASIARKEKTDVSWKDYARNNE